MNVYLSTILALTFFAVASTVMILIAEHIARCVHIHRKRRRAFDRRRAAAFYNYDLPTTQERENLS